MAPTDLIQALVVPRTQAANLNDIPFFADGVNYSDVVNMLVTRIGHYDTQSPTQEHPRVGGSIPFESIRGKLYTR